MIEVVSDVLHRQSLVDIAFHDPLDALIDSFHPPLSLPAEPYAGRQDQTDRRNGAQDQCLRDDVRQRRQNADAATEDQYPAVGQRAGDGDDRLRNGMFAGLDQFNFVDLAVRREIGWYRLQVAGNEVTAGSEQRRENLVIKRIPTVSGPLASARSTGFRRSTPVRRVLASVETKALMRLVSNSFVCQ